MLRALPASLFRIIMNPTPPSVPLHYTIATSTPHSGKYGPEHILLDKPQDQSSRWSGACQGSHTNPKQYILLKLDQMSILSASFRMNLALPLLRVYLLRDNNFREG